ncbi:hypothetical protein V8C44DRAFT_339042 [Trichoderma aethiopicum]
MATTVITQSPVFAALALIQATFDEFPNPGDNSEFSTCRSFTKGSTRCQTKIKQELGAKIKGLLSKFEKMTKCPATESFYEDMKSFIISTHCHRHRDAVLEAFEKWKDVRTATTSALRSVSQMDSLTSSLEKLLLSADSRSSVERSRSNWRAGHLFNRQASFIESEEGSEYEVPEEEDASDESEGGDAIDESDEEGAFDESDEEGAFYESEDEDAIDVSEDDEDIVQSVANRTRQAKRSLSIQESSTRRINDAGHVDDKLIDFTGIGLCRRRGSFIQKNSPLRLAILGCISNRSMLEGVVYVLKHIHRPNFFKVGFTTTDARDRLKKNPCFRRHAEIIYESRVRFLGAERAEMIIHKELESCNILLKECIKCRKGHREWFDAPVDEILDTIRKIELFVRLPAYALHDGEWGPSELAYEVFRHMYGPDARPWREILRVDARTGMPTAYIPLVARR